MKLTSARARKLRPTVRVHQRCQRRPSAIFQKVGQGHRVDEIQCRHGAGDESRLFGRSRFSCPDYYAGDWFDQLDALKTNIDERQVIANAGAYALGRKTDDLIIAALTGTSQTITDGGHGPHLRENHEARFQDARQRTRCRMTATVMPSSAGKQWSDLLQIRRILRIRQLCRHGGAALRRRDARRRNGSARHGCRTPV